MTGDVDVEEKVDQGWINVEIMIETQGNDSEFLKDSLKNMVKKLENEDKVIVYEKSFEDIEETKKGWFSYICDVKLLTQNFETLVNVSMHYGPSSVEIIEPSKISIGIGEAQSTLANIADVTTSLAHRVFVQDRLLLKQKLALEAQKKSKVVKKAPRKKSG